MELGRRFVLILFVVVFPANNVKGTVVFVTTVFIFCSCIQFPAMLIVSVFIVATGLTWPYKDVCSTMLDLLLSVDVLLLLLFKNTRQFIDDYSGVTLEGAVSFPQCIEYSFQPSTLSYILLPFYYLPLLLFVVALCVWIGALIRYRIRTM